MNPSAFAFIAVGASVELQPSGGTGNWLVDLRSRATAIRMGRWTSRSGSLLQAVLSGTDMGLVATRAGTKAPTGQRQAWNRDPRRLLTSLNVDTSFTTTGDTPR